MHHSHSLSPAQACRSPALCCTGSRCCDPCRASSCPASGALTACNSAGPPTTAQPRPSRLFDGRSGLWAPWQAAGNMDFGTFCERLQRNTEKVGRQLVHNVQLVGTSLYSVAKQTTEEIRRRGGQ